MLKYKHSYKIRYSEAILSNNTRKLLWFEITKLKNRVIYNNFGTLLFPTGSIRRIFGEVKTSGSRHVLADRQTDRQTYRHAHCNSLSFHGHRQFRSQQYDFNAQRATNLHGGELKLLQVDTILPQRVRITTNDNRRTSTPHDSRSRLWFAHRMSTVVQA